MVEAEVRCMYERERMCVRGGVWRRRGKNQADRGRDERQAVWGGVEDGWSAVGGKRGKPQRNKRPSGLIRRQIGCRAQRGREEERESGRYRGGERV